jgi:Fur family ferric uptake transcriptional regulator
MNYRIIEVLERHNVKPTAMRMLVLQQLCAARKHLSLSEIETALYPADRVTIYRTLQTFVRKGIAHTVDTLHSGAVYGLCNGDCNAENHNDEHPHFICENCKTITCTDDFSYTIQKKTNNTSHKIHKIEVTIKGLCPNCTSKQ